VPKSLLNKALRAPSITAAVSLLILLIAGPADGQGLICHACNKSLPGPLIEYDGWNYHRSCYLEKIAARCGVCSLPITDGEWTAVEGIPYHNHCFEDSVAPICSICNQLIEGSYIENRWGERYHAHHQGEVMTCSFCDRLIDAPAKGNGHIFHGTRFICRICSKDAIDDEQDADRRREEISAGLAAVGIVISNIDLRLQLVDPAGLEDATDRRGNKTLGLFRGGRRTFASGGPDDLTGTISIATGLPPAVFTGTTAHELMHVWLFVHEVEDRDEAWVEGSCNFAAWLTLGRTLSDEFSWCQDALMEDPNPVYGDGFRRVKKLVDERGIDFWLKQLRTSPDFPSGY
jgi:hypothetical protein